jgi:AbrB family looped-hinge helix DNA binding protein
MTIARSKLTAQGQISVPAEIRRKLGLAPGSSLEWDEEGDHIVVRRAGRYSSADIHEAIFRSTKRRPAKPVDVKEGVRKAIRKRHARR